jgi:hypothetical protein
MKKFVSTIILFSISHVIIKAQSLVILPNAGVQTTFSTINGLSPFSSVNKQFQTNATFGLRGYLDNKKGRGLFFGIQYVNSGLKYSYVNGNETGFMSSNNSFPRLELGYQVLSKQVYFNNILNNINAKKNTGLFFQIQPMLGFGYNILNNSSTNGSIGGGSVELKTYGGASGNYSLLTGANMYFGKNDKQWFFISIMKNWNFGNNSDVGTIKSQYNGSTFENNIKSLGSGNAVTIGVPIKINFRKKR